MQWACQVVLAMNIVLFTHTIENKVILKMRKKRGMKRGERLVSKKVKERW